VLPTFATDNSRMILAAHPGESPRAAAAVLRWCTRLLATAVLLCLGVALGGASALAATPAHSIPASPKTTHAAGPVQIQLIAYPTPLRAAGLTAPAAGGTPVAAAGSGAVWDRIARCESGGRWNISTGNGYSGGLQFTPSTWRAYGGTHYASSASHATRAQQIAIAERVLAGQGPGAWPTCSHKAGLTRDHTEQHDNTEQHGHSRHQSASHRGQHSAHRRAHRRAHRGGGDSGAADAATIVVKPGDTLSSLATAHHVPGGWQQLYQANRDQPGANPNSIHAGQRLSLPSA
jgi:nucleoid-associated protein YgaU